MQIIILEWPFLPSNAFIDDTLKSSQPSVNRRYKNNFFTTEYFIRQTFMVFGEDFVTLQPENNEETFFGEFVSRLCLKKKTALQIADFQ